MSIGVIFGTAAAMAWVIYAGFSHPYVLITAIILTILMVIGIYEDLS